MSCSGLRFARCICAAGLALSVAAPTAAHAQAVSIHGAAGPTLGDVGHSVAGGLGVSPLPWMTVTVSAERSHLPSRRQTFPGSVSHFRGGTFTLASVEAQILPLGRDRIGPYALVGFGVGRSRPNVTPVFPTPVVTSVVAPFAGGGLRVPVGERLSFFADLRLALVVGTESDDLYALTPLRAGLSWRF